MIGANVFRFVNQILKPHTLYYCIELENSYTKTQTHIVKVIGQKQEYNFLEEACMVGVSSTSK